MRKVFFSFHYNRDSWRVSQIKNMGVVEGQKICNSNEWEKVKNEGDVSIKKWIDENMFGCSCVIVLIGNQTANRRWINYEIVKAWNAGKTLLGIYIHNLKDKNGNKDSIGYNPFEYIEIKSSKEKLSEFIPVFNPKSDNAYRDIESNLENWIEQAIKNKKKLRYL